VGDTVTISGEWEENDYFSPDDADVALLLGDDAGKKLLVIPQPGVAVPRMGEDTVVRVKGTVRSVDPEAEGVTGDGLVRQGDLLTVGPNAIVSAAEVELTPPVRDAVGRDLRFRVATVPRLYEEREVFEDRPVVVVGRASAIGERGFVLTQDGRSVFVSAPASKLERLNRGEKVRVRGEVAALSRLRTEVANQTAENAARRPPADVPFSAGDPYVLLRTLDGQGPGPLESDVPVIA
jgi:hypothetical protein